MVFDEIQRDHDQELLHSFDDWVLLDDYTMLISDCMVSSMMLM